jgi:hypothetical protein
LTAGLRHTACDKNRSRSGASRGSDAAVPHRVEAVVPLCYVPSQVLVVYPGPLGAGWRWMASTWLNGCCGRLLSMSSRTSSRWRVVSRKSLFDRSEMGRLRNEEGSDGGNEMRVRASSSELAVTSHVVMTSTRKKALLYTCHTGRLEPQQQDCMHSGVAGSKSYALRGH